MTRSNKKISKGEISHLLGFINKYSLRNAIYFSGGIIVFIAGTIVYGIVLNLRENTLAEAMAEKGFQNLKNPNLVIVRKSFSLQLYEDSVLIKNYRASFGKNLSVAKSRADDNATPVGEYAICDIDSNHRYHRFLRINYPNMNDATEALRRGFITQKQFDKIKFEFYYKGCPDEDAVLGGNLGIHGIGKFNFIFKNLPFVYNWTDGSIALSNEAVDEILSVVKKGTTVVIK